MIIFTGSFNPIHINHLRLLEFVKNDLEKSFKYDVISGFVVPTHDQALRKKHGGTLPISKEHRKNLILSAVEDMSWVIPYFEIIDGVENEGLGKANQDIASLMKDNYGQMKVTIIQMQGIDNIEIAVKIARHN